MPNVQTTEKQKDSAQAISELRAEFKTVDADEDAKCGPGKRGDELPVELANRRGRAVAMAIARASIEAEAAAKARTEVEEKAANLGAGSRAGQYPAKASIC